MRLIESFKPNSYLPSVYDINYYKLSENGIRYAVFDVDCTLLPFDDIRVKEEDEILFGYIYLLGIKTALCSSGSDERVRPVAEKLNTRYMARAHKPWVNFNEIKNLFDDECKPENTMFVGDSLYLDMLLADRNRMYKVLVDMIRDKPNIKLLANDIIQTVMYTALKTEGFQYHKYYRGARERI